MPRASRPKRLPKVLTEAEVEALRGRFRGKSVTGLRNRAIVEAMLGAGLRVAEACGLMASDVDLTEGSIRVNLGKGGRDRVVPIDGETCGWLRAWAEKRGRLGVNGRRPFFCAVRQGATGSALRTEQVERMVRNAAEEAGIQEQDPVTRRHKVTPHALRHTYATRMLRLGFDVSEVQALLGHANLGTTSVYLHADPVRLREKVQGQKPADPQVARLAEALAKLPAEARAALLEALQEGG